MPVSYPATMPTSGVTSINWTNSTSSTITKSPFSFQGQAQSYGGAIRSAQVTVENLNREQAEDWLGFLDSLNGTIGTFLFGDPMAKTPMGVGSSGSITIDAINASTKDVIRVNTPIRTVTGGFLKRGDWFQIGTGTSSRLYKLAVNVNVDATGVSTNLIFWPTLRIMPAVGDNIYINEPKGLFRRSSGSYSYSEVDGCKYSLSFDCEEVI